NPVDSPGRPAFRGPSASILARRGAMSKLKILFTLVASLATFFLFANEAHATHFRYGNITYTVPDPINAPTTVRFDAIVAWRFDYVDSVVLQFGDGQQLAGTQGTKIGE